MAEEIAYNLAGKKVANIYGGLLHLPRSIDTNNQKQLVYDGYGKASAMSLGGENSGMDISGPIKATGNIQSIGDGIIGGNLTVNNINLTNGGSINTVGISAVDSDVSIRSIKTAEVGNLRIRETSGDYEVIFGNPNNQNSKLFSIIVKSDTGANATGSQSHFYIKNNYSDSDSVSPLWINKNGEVNIQKLNVYGKLNSYTNPANLPAGQPANSNRNQIPVGCVCSFPSLATPDGWFKCDGSSKSTTSFPELCAVIGYAYGGSGTSFSVPNFTSVLNQFSYFIKW